MQADGQLDFLSGFDLGPIPARCLSRSLISGRKLLSQAKVIKVKVHTAGGDIRSQANIVLYRNRLINHD